MNPHQLENALKRERLIERIGTQRRLLAGQAGGIRRLCAGGDRVLAAGHKLREHPEWVLLALLALVVVRPRRAWRLAKAGFVVWRTWAAIRKRLPVLAAR